MRDRHHLLFNRQEWRLRPEAKAIREQPSLVPTIEREVHEEIHANCPAVPLLGYQALVRVNKIYTSGHDTLQSMDNLMLAIEHSTTLRSHRIERELAGLAVWAVSLQRPFIEEALVIPNTQTIIDLAA